MVARDASAKHDEERKATPSGKTHEKTDALSLVDGGSIVLTVAVVARDASAKHDEERKATPSGKTHEKTDALSLACGGSIVLTAAVESNLRAAGGR